MNPRPVLLRHRILVPFPQTKILPHNPLPFIASAIPAYTRSLEKKAEMKIKKKVSEFVGEIGDKISADVEVIGSKVVNGFYGSTLLVRMADTDGNTFTTFYSGYNAEPEIGDKISISGTVKKHDIFKGWKSTVLKRVKFSAWQTLLSVL